METVTFKDSAFITKIDADYLIENRIDKIEKRGDIVDFIIVKMKSDGYKPRVVVEYDKEAYFRRY